ncbi:hypothetical protein [Caldimonas brevitalea]|uniref:Uncharacterized protein n=1 Tax=Caldimonas brevitalea TaxID=413882 RepID=A0A0G3BD41_9BURK|nr:hypothetical protein [Caldimonas brevitalea]AKJ27279.1 hypothetical protein AAW51_0588 [Caldimonas brevitalea]
MKRHPILIGLWVAVATFVLGRLWIARPDIGPSFPDWFAGWFLKVTGVTNQESAADAEALLLYGICFVVVSLGTWAVLRLTRKH